VQGVEKFDNVEVCAACSGGYLNTLAMIVLEWLQ
jgi:hypothetical protein